MRTRIEAFNVDDNGMSVHVYEDGDLSLKFKRGEVAEGNSGDVYVAMILGVDGEPIDLICTSGGPDGIDEVLRMMKYAIERALEGLPQV